VRAAFGTGPGRRPRFAHCEKTIPLLERSRYGGLYAFQRLAQRFLALQRGRWGRWGRRTDRYDQWRRSARPLYLDLSRFKRKIAVCTLSYHIKAFDGA